MASSAPSCEPDTNTIRSDDRSGLRLHLLQRIEHPRQHDRHHDHRGHLVLLDVLEHRRRLEAAPQHQRVAEHHRDGGVQEAQRVEHRRGQRRHLAGLERHVREHPADRRQRRRRTSVGALGSSGGAAGQNDDRRMLGRLGCGLAAAARDEVFQRLVGAARRLLLIGVVAERAQLAEFRYPPWTPPRSTRRRR